MTKKSDFYWSTPDLSTAAFVADNATVIGDVNLAEGSSVWYGAVVRGDAGKPTILEDYVTVGHRAVIHSAHIETGCLIGIGAIILDGVRVASGSIVGAGSVVTKDVPTRSLVVGIPARKVREVSESQAQELLEHARKYAKLAQVHAGTGTDLGFS